VVQDLTLGKIIDTEGQKEAAVLEALSRV